MLYILKKSMTGILNSNLSFRVAANVLQLRDASLRGSEIRLVLCRCCYKPFFFTELAVVR